MQKKDLSWLTARPIAHRGLHDKSQGIIENCAMAFQGAIDNNFAIELDVQVTKDGMAAVFHDYELERLTKGTGHVDQLTMAELSRIDFKQGCDHIQELEEMLAQVAGRVPVVIELKTPRQNDGKLEKRVAEVLDSYDGLAVVMAFSPILVKSLASLTDRPRGIVSCDYFQSEDGMDLSDDQRYQLTHLLHAPKTKPDFISYGAKYLPAPSADLLKALYGLPVICWTTRSIQDHHEALQYCDQVTFEGYNPDDIA